jgi:hypothetical protein
MAQWQNISDALHRPATLLLDPVLKITCFMPSTITLPTLAQEFRHAPNTSQSE